MVSTPLVIRSFIIRPTLKQMRLWVGVYAGLVSVILVILSVKQQGYSYDIRYAPVILVYAYLGPVPGIIAGSFSLITRLLSGGNWLPAIVGWVINIAILTVVYRYIPRLTPIKKSAVLSCGYIVGYLCTVFTFQILIAWPLFHLQYLLFVLLGVVIGGLLIESNERLRRIIAEKSYMEKTLEVSESQYRLIAENTSDLIALMDKDYSVSYFSPSHEHILGYIRSELEGVELCSFVHEDDVVMFRSAIKKMFADSESHAMEFRLRHKDGRWVEFESRCRPVVGAAGSIDHVVIISRDITERKKAEEFLLQSEKLSVVGKLAAGVAHEIRNPLTTMKGFLQLYSRENPSMRNSDLLLSELERIEMITNEFLSLAKPQSIQLTDTDLKELLENTVELLSPQALLNNIEFIHGFAGAKFPITCEKNQLKQVFLNILKNAIESMPGGGEIHISLRVEATEAYIISIKDHGCGIPEELLPQLGQPFYSLKEKGTGLGLMVSHRIIKQHHGSIAYQSKGNEGTLIEIKLPIR